MKTQGNTVTLHILCRMDRKHKIDNNQEPDAKRLKTINNVYVINLIDIDYRMF